MSTISGERAGPARQTPVSEAARAILDVAEELAQTRGYNGFSYADIAEKLGVTKASLHYHFASKAALGHALIVRYKESFGAALDAIDQGPATPPEKLRRYVQLYDAVMRNDRMCLCGMLAAEYSTLPAPMQKGLVEFFHLNQRWLSAVLEEGQKTGSLVFSGPPGERAELILGALEGAMLMARSYGNAARFHVAAQHVLEDLGVGRKKNSNGKGKRSH